MSDYEDEGDHDLAKEYRSAFNTRRRPSARRLISSSPISVDEEDPLEPASLEVQDDELVYRELNDQTGNSTILKKTIARLCPQPIYNSIKPPLTKHEILKFWKIHVPIWNWLYHYVPKLLIGDIVAGLTIGVTHIPQGIGFALLAMVPPVFGLYSSFIPVLLYTIFGTSKHLSVGTFPIVSLMTADSVNRLSGDYPDCNNNDTMNITDMMDDDECYISSCNQYRVEIAIALSFLVGLILMIMSFLKLGFVSIFLSDALISGYTAAAAFSIVVTQISFLFGLEDTAVPDGWFVTPRRFYKYCTRIVQGRLTPAAIVTSIVCFIILISIELTNRLIKKKFKKIPIYIPGQLIVVILCTFISYVAKLNDRFGLEVINDVGGIPPGKCFSPTIPTGSLFGKLFTDAIVIAIVSFALNIAQAKLLAIKNSYSIHPDQELFAYGIMNLGGSFFGSIPTAGALSRTVLQDAVGGNTQLVGLISSCLVLFVILILGFLFDFLPNATVAVIVVMALKGLIFQVRDVRRYFYLHWPDMFVWFIVFFATLIIRLDIGLLIGVGASILIVVIRTILPFSPGLGEAHAWIYPVKGSKPVYDYSEQELKVHDIPNIYIYQFNAPLYFANCAVFRSRLFINCNVNPEIFDSVGKSCFQMCSKKQSYSMHAPDSTNDNTVDVSLDIVDTGIQSPDVQQSSHHLDVSRYRTIVIDCGPICFVDSMGSAMLERVVREFESVNIQVLFAAPNTPVCDALDRYGFFKRYSAERLFPSVTNAVHYAKSGHKVADLTDPKRISKKLASNLERQLAIPVRPSLLELSSVETPKAGPATLYKVTKQTESSV